MNKNEMLKEYYAAKGEEKQQILKQLQKNWLMSFNSLNTVIWGPFVNKTYTMSSSIFTSVSNLSPSFTYPYALSMNITSYTVSTEDILIGINIRDKTTTLVNPDQNGYRLDQANGNQIGILLTLTTSNTITTLISYITDPSNGTFSFGPNIPVNTAFNPNTFITFGEDKTGTPYIGFYDPGNVSYNKKILITVPALQNKLLPNNTRSATLIAYKGVGGVTTNNVNINANINSGLMENVIS